MKSIWSKIKNYLLAISLIATVFLILYFMLNVFIIIIAISTVVMAFVTLIKTFKKH